MDPLPISSIQIGNRARKDMGDLQGLADSIKRHGLLHPVVVKSDGTLVAGHRRLEAVKLLGVDVIPATIIDVADLLSAERDENTERKDFTPTEAVAIGRLIEEEHRAKIALQEDERKRHGKLTTVKELGQEPLGETREAAAGAVGLSPSSYSRAKAVVLAAEENPEQFGDLPSVMDETRNVTGAHREMERRQGRVVKKVTPLSKTGKNLERIQDQQFRAAIWQQVRDALTNLSTLPEAAEVVRICRAQMRDKNFVDTKLPIALNYLQEFANEWSKDREIAA